MQTHRRLGRGLSSLIGEPVAVKVPEATASGPARAADSPKVEGGKESSVLPERLRLIALGSVSPGQFQPRRAFDDGGLQRLAESIRTAGVMQPIVVRPLAAVGGGSGGGTGGGTGGRGASATYELVAGERRWRAAALAGLTEIPALVAELGDEEAAEFGLIENLQREDLGPMERARALRNLAERFGLTHADVASRLGLERASVSNMVRLTELEPEITAMLERGELGVGHAKVLLTVAPGRGRIELAQRAAGQAWSVRKLESRAQPGSTLVAGESPARVVTEAGAAEQTRRDGLLDLERQLGEHLGTKVKISTDRTGRRGRISVQFFDLDHFDGLMSKFAFRMR